MTKLSKRLEMIAGLCGKCGVLADVGCDHAYLPIFMVESGQASSAYAMDLREGPLKIAEENIKAAGLSDKIAIKLSDGADALKPGDCDVISVSGMGGVLICRILEVGKEVFLSASAVVLQPQSDVDLVRKKLLELGFRIDAEDCTVDEGKFYTAIRAIPGKDEAYAAASETEFKYGKYLLESKNPVLKIHLYERLGRCDEIIASMRLDGRKLFNEPVNSEREAVLAALKYYE
ncbi:MAG: class I SAM-dependent methyltransferase [Lachnospiraceae bacterium]|nr:class I SAM-dependent methyltransferase [Lachnospiraceae bacterium]